MKTNRQKAEEEKFNKARDTWKPGVEGWYLPIWDDYDSGDNGYHEPKKFKVTRTDFNNFKHYGIWVESEESDPAYRALRQRAGLPTAHEYYIDVQNEYIFPGEADALDFYKKKLESQLSSHLDSAANLETEIGKIQRKIDALLRKPSTTSA